MLKKIFIISSVLLLVVLVFFGIYSIAFKQESLEGFGDEIKKDDDVAMAVSEKITNIKSEPIIESTIGPDNNNIRYYDAITGQVKTMTFRGTNQDTLVNETTGIPQSVKWSHNGEKSIVTYEGEGVFVYNHDTNTENKLRDGMDSVVWAGAGNKILYKYYDQGSGERTLNIANADGTNWKKLAEIPFRYIDFVQIPSSILAAFWPVADNNVMTELLTTSTINANIPKQIFTGKNGANFLFSPNGKDVLVSSTSNDGKDITLGVMDNNGLNYNDLIVPTITEKATWSKDGKTVYYAQPNDVPNNVVWPNDYYDKNGFTTRDTFYKMDITTGKKLRIIELDEIKEKIDATNLFLSPTEDALFFTNRINNLLYRLNL